jgi:hypothetical protein
MVVYLYEMLFVGRFFSVVAVIVAVGATVQFA